jgi:predicted nucleotidyltransferase
VLASELNQFDTLEEMNQSTTQLPLHPAAQLAEARLRLHVDKYFAHARVWLFGSRARGEALRRSDFDLAFEPLEGFENASLLAFEDAVQNDPEIIYPIDLVNLSESGDTLRQQIEREGILWKS